MVKSPSPAVVAVLGKGVTDARDQLAALINHDTGDLRAFDAMRDKVDAMEQFVSALDVLHGDPAAAVAKALDTPPDPVVAFSVGQSPPPAPTPAQQIAAALGVRPVDDISSIDSINHL